MQQVDVIERIKDLCTARSWTYYRLAKESGITYSTLNTMLNKTASPSLPTLIKICEGFGITLSDFFCEDAGRAALSPEERELLQNWNRLSADNQKSASSYISFLSAMQD